MSDPFSFSPIWQYRTKNTEDWKPPKKKKKEIFDVSSVLRIKVQIQAHVPFASSLDAELQSSKLAVLQRTYVYVDITSIPRVCLAPSWHMAEGFYD